jgi:hypothetical protein
MLEQVRAYLPPGQAANYNTEDLDRLAKSKGF